MSLSADVQPAEKLHLGPDGALILASIGHVPYEWDLRTDALRWAANVSDVLSFDPGEISTGRDLARFLVPDNVSTPFDAVMQSARADGGNGVAYEIEYALTTRSGVKLWVKDSGRWFAGLDGRPSNAHGVIRVATEQHEREKRLLYLSKFDELTGEVNRWTMTELVATASADAIRLGRSCAFLLIAIDNLSMINESLGFDHADEVISSVSKRLRSQLRAGDVLGRFSGNKFGLLLQNCEFNEMDIAAERLIGCVRGQMIETSAGPVAVTTTVGGIAIPRHGRTMQEILERAQNTLSSAKAKRPGSFLAYRPNIERDKLRRDALCATNEIVTALNERRFHLAFEPIVDADTREVALYECLTRIERADGSIATAGTIIPIAEKLGLIRLIDQRLVELVISELAETPELRLSVNVSPLSISDTEWWSTLSSHLRATPGASERLTVEITEMTAVQNVDEARAFVNRVKDLGCRIAIDDFGAGYTSFRNLRKLGVDIIKIDGAFIENLSRSADDRAFTNAMISLGHSLGLQTIAEWVQDEATATLLAGYGCHFLQGALVGLASSQRAWPLPHKISASA